MLEMESGGNARKMFYKICFEDLGASPAPRPPLSLDCALPRRVMLRHMLRPLLRPLLRPAQRQSPD